MEGKCIENLTQAQLSKLAEMAETFANNCSFLVARPSGFGGLSLQHSDVVLSVRDAGGNKLAVYAFNTRGNRTR